MTISQQKEQIRLANNNLRWITMKEAQLLGAVLARLISALIALSPTAFADESVNEYQHNPNIVTENGKQWNTPPSYAHWTIPPINKQWGIPPRANHWTIPPVNKQWDIPPRSKHWAIPRSASSLKYPSLTGDSSEIQD